MSEKNKKSQLIFIFLTVFIYLLGFGIIIPITPILSRDLGATATEAGLLMASYSLMQFIFSPFWGRLSDSYGRRPILLFCMLCEGFSYLLFASARSLPMLFLARIMAGFFGASIATASAYISDITPPHERSKGMALIGVAFGLGFVFGPAIGGLLSTWGHHISPEPLFDTTFTAIWVAVICFGNFLFGWKFLKESLLTRASKKNRLSRFKVLMNGLSIRTLGPLLVIYFLVSFSMSSMEATLVWFMADRFNWGLREVSFGFAYIGVILILTQGLIVRRLLPKIGEKKTIVMGLFFFILGMAGIIFSINIPMMALTMTALAIGNGLFNPATLGSISLLAPKDEQGVTMGLSQSLASLGRIAGPAFGGLIYTHLSITAPFSSSSLLALVALVVTFLILPQIPSTAMDRQI